MNDICDLALTINECHSFRKGHLGQVNFIVIEIRENNLQISSLVSPTPDQMLLILDRTRIRWPHVS
ncbi:MAG TPA: hypothetical protein VFC78_21735 [Tepidisphaeraceae bacterium]|nr:hypothetical protein [Tepidisphaeraceae bacterium]